MVGLERNNNPETSFLRMPTQQLMWDMCQTKTQHFHQVCVYSLEYQQLFHYCIIFLFILKCFCIENWKKGFFFLSSPQNYQHLWMFNSPSQHFLVVYLKVLQSCNICLSAHIINRNDIYFFKAFYKKKSCSNLLSMKKDLLKVFIYPFEC